MTKPIGAISEVRLSGACGKLLDIMSPTALISSAYNISNNILIYICYNIHNTAISFNYK